MSNERLKRSQRHIIERIIVRGTLVLDTPTCLGSGDAEGVTDLMLLRDSISSKALLTGASIAGALRNYVYEYQYGYPKRNNDQEDEPKNPNNIANLATYLFGAERKDENGNQSPLIIHDSISSEVPKVEIRDGLKINSQTGTADDKAKYDLELLASGTEFPLRFELLIEEKETNKNLLLEALVLALQGLENNEINIGMKKNRGFGRCHVETWDVWQFNLQNYQQRLTWLLFDRECNPNSQDSICQHGKIADILKVKITRTDERCRFFMKATFKLAGSLLIRSGHFSIDPVPDVVHLKSYRKNSQQLEKQELVLSGTSLAGVLRHRAERIVKTLGDRNTIINDLFGEVDEEQKKANSSRLVVRESVIHNVTELVQNRIAIDRFTGGAYHGALFDEQPIFGKDDTRVTLELELRQPSNAEIGLLLLLLKDLWTSDLPVGGESSIGRGRLEGIHAEMTRCTPEGKKTWTIKQNQNRHLKISNARELEFFVREFVGKVEATR
ncbi:MAG: hypothetical protein J7642_01325 [Cyanobacteria bacterium SBC]|nr:hypothetical protein [Cyanobacteria bacterium SBC]